jgi:hypothetical protein
MALPPLPPLFERVPDGLFGPLNGATAPLHFRILGRLYQHEFEREPFWLVKQAALSVAEEEIAESPLWRERRAELVSAESDEEAVFPDDETALLRATARRMIARQERAGWFRFEYRSEIGMILSFYPYAVRILETLVRVARDEQPEFQGFAHSIAVLLRAETFTARPGVSLREARRQTLDMVRELKILERNIYAFTQRLLDEAATAANVLERGIDHYREAVLANYHRLKTVDNLHKWRGEILYRLDEIEIDSIVLERAAAFYAEQLRVDSASAREAVRADLDLMRVRFETLPEITNDIDARNARFSGVALRKLMYLLRQDRRTEGLLQLIIDAVADDAAPDVTFDVFRCELLPEGLACLYTPPAQRQQVSPQKLQKQEPADTDALRKTAVERLKRPFARAQVEAFVERALAGRSRQSIEVASPSDDEEYVRLIYIVLYGLDASSTFRFTQGTGRLDNESYKFPTGDLERKTRRR